MRTERPGLSFLKASLGFIALLALPACLELLPYDRSARFEPVAAFDDRFAVVIGVSDYSSPRMDLKYAKKDAEAFRDALIKRCRFSKENVRLLVDREATRESIRKAIEGWLSQKSKSADAIVVYFSGHGTRAPDNDNDEEDGFDEFLLPYDFDPSDLTSGIRDDDFAFWIRTLKCDRTLLIFDSCFSGGSARARGVDIMPFKGGFKGDGVEKEVLGEVPRKGVALLSASTADQTSWEETEFSNGVFTHFLLDGLAGMADSDADQVITLTELYRFVKREVVNHSDKRGRKQEPVLIDQLEKPLDLAFTAAGNVTLKDKNSQRARELKQQADLLGFSNPEKKVELLQEAVALDPKNWDLRHELIFALSIARRPADVIREGEASISLMPKRGPDTVLAGGWCSLMAEAAQHLGDTKKALRYAEKAAEIDSRHSLVLARILSSQQLYDEAYTVYIRYVQEFPVQDQAYCEMARIQIRKEQYGEADKLLNKALSYNPSCSAGNYIKSVLLKYVDNDIDGAELLKTKFGSSLDSLTLHIDTARLSISEFRRYQAAGLTLRAASSRAEAISKLKSIIEEKDYYVDAYLDLIDILKEQPGAEQERDSYCARLTTIYPFMSKRCN